VDKTRLDLEYNNLLTAKERLEEARARAALALSEAQAGVTQAEETLRQARARLAELEDQAAVTTAKAALRQTELDYQQAVENADPSSPNMKLLALDVQRAQVSEVELAAAEIKVAQARLDLESAQRGLEAVKLVAPTAGTVTAVETVPGAVVSGGTPIVTLLDTAQLEFHTTNLSERDLAQISPGQAAVVTLKAYPDEPIEARVARLGLQAGAAVGDAATFPVILALSETGLNLRPGMTGRAEIRTEEP
jgi:HlyD family secretion protein